VLECGRNRVNPTEAMMRTALSVLLLLVAVPAATSEPNFHPRPESSLVWSSEAPTAHAFHNGQQVPCYETVRREVDSSGTGHYVHRYRECVEPAHEVSDIGESAFGPPINVGGVREATRVRIKRDGAIVLY